MYNMYTCSHELHEFKILSNVEIFTLWSFLQVVYENLTKILLKMKIPKHFLFYSMILSSHILCTNTAIHCLSFLYLSSISKLSSQIIHFLNKIFKKKDWWSYLTSSWTWVELFCQKFNPLEHRGLIKKQRSLFCMMLYKTQDQHFELLMIKYSKIHSRQSARDKQLRFVKNVNHYN